jgi:dihydropteroate synthase
MTTKTKIVGILNITPDSFSDGNLYNDEESILSQTLKLIKDGADIIDVGAESTRPNAEKLSDTQEWQRLSPVLEKIIALCHQHKVKVSLDSFHPSSVKRAIGLGVDFINDVNGLKNPQMIEALKNSTVKIVVMHSLTVPADKSVNIPEELDVVNELKIWFNNHMRFLNSCGIDNSRLIFDPGIGFNKTVKQCWEVINRASELKQLGIPIYIGHSRKSFLGELSQRDEKTLIVSKQLIANNIDYIRVHDVLSHNVIIS